MATLKGFHGVLSRSNRKKVWSISNYRVLYWTVPVKRAARHGLGLPADLKYVPSLNFDRGL